MEDKKNPDLSILYEKKCISWQEYRTVNSVSCVWLKEAFYIVTHDLHSGKDRLETGII